MERSDNPHRNDKAIETFRRLAAEFFEAEANPMPLITVTNISASPDVRTVTVFISVFPESRAEEALRYGERKLGDLRDFVKSRIKTRAIPTFSLALDRGESLRRKLEGLPE